MWHSTETSLIDKLTGYTANTISLILNTHQCLLEVVNELDLAACKLSKLLTLHSSTTVFHIHVTVLSVFCSCLILAGDQALEVIQLFSGCFQAVLNQFTEFIQFFIAIAIHGSLFFCWLIQN